MANAEQLAFSIRVEPRTLHLLLWDDQAELERALIILLAALHDIPYHFSLVANDEDSQFALRELVISRSVLEDESASGSKPSHELGSHFWLIFIQQAVCKQVGPWLNGWRHPLSAPPGSLIVIRNADFNAFQTYAPDLMSFVGPRIFEAERMLSLVSKKTLSRIDLVLPSTAATILAQLPGTRPPASDLARWQSILEINAASAD